MGVSSDSQSAFQKTEVPCLYRYSSNGVYYALFKHEGKQKRISLRTTDKTEAKRLLRDRQTEMGRVDSSQGKLTLESLAERYLTTIQAQGTSTVALKTCIIRRLLAEFPEGRRIEVSKIKPSDLSGWVESHRFKYSSHNHYVQVLKALFEMAVNDRALADSPARILKGKKVVTPRRVTPSYSEFQEIIADVRSQKGNAAAEESGDFLEFLGLLGVGQAEASGIQKQHVNLSKQQLTFFRVKTRKPYFIPIFPQARALVMKRYERTQAQIDPLFPLNLAKSKNQRASTRKNAKKALDSSCQRLNFPPYTQRSLRRMFITRCIEKGIDVKVIADWQGHSDGGRLILGTYSHVRNAHAEKMASLLVDE